MISSKKNRDSRLYFREMPQVRIINLSKNTALAEKAKLADNFFQRLIGLMGKANLPAGGALILKPCTSIHTIFMRFPIDAAFVNRQNRIIKIYPCLKPWRLTGMFFNSLLCLELPVGTLATTRSQAGDTIQFANNL